MTVSETVVECMSAPLVPVIVSVKGPVAVPVVVTTVSVEVPAGVREVGLRVQVPPDGQPETVRLTVPPNPFNAVTVIVEVPVAPCVSVSDVGLAEIEKSGAATVTVNVVV